MADEKIYAKGAYAKQIEGKYGDILKLSLKVEDFKQFIDQHKNEKGYVNLAIMSKREPDERGNTHNVMLDTWKPQEGGQRSAPTQQRQASKPAPKQAEPTSDDVPF